MFRHRKKGDFFKSGKETESLNLGQGFHMIPQSTTGKRLATHCCPDCPVAWRENPLIDVSDKSPCRVSFSPRGSVLFKETCFMSRIIGDHQIVSPDPAIASRLGFE